MGFPKGGQGFPQRKGAPFCLEKGVASGRPNPANQEHCQAPLPFPRGFGGRPVSPDPPPPEIFRIRRERSRGDLWEILGRTGPGFKDPGLDFPRAPGEGNRGKEKKPRGPPPKRGERPLEPQYQQPQDSGNPPWGPKPLRP
ncbi:basic salivary proline-rich protein 3-like [Penaeus monodon]|uniref:basic salivary proline-rich protein 3-like n=1 Tax=Penaeus monodon TaxID=6687 RepID=UPI0018A6DF6C|nr:basic salivary proline-rich protein 3-like [Penaeus monodon]